MVALLSFAACGWAYGTPSRRTTYLKELIADEPCPHLGHGSGQVGVAAPNLDKVHRSTPKKVLLDALLHRAPANSYNELFRRIGSARKNTCYLAYPMKMRYTFAVTRTTKTRTMTQTNYTREIADIICTRMSEGESLRSICRDPGMPSEGTVRGWAVRDVDGFSHRYQAARQMLLEYWSDEIVSIADDEESDPRSRQIRTGVRQWLMSKLAPRRYGDKVQISGDPESPLQVMHREVSLETLSDAQLDALQRFAQSLLIEAKPD